MKEEHLTAASPSFRADYFWHIIAQLRLPAILASIASLMELGLDDGEEAMVISSDYVIISCLVTSASGPVSFETGEGALVHGSVASTRDLCS